MKKPARFSRKTFSDAQETGPRSGPRCRVAQFRETLTLAEDQSFREAVADERILMTSVFRVAKEYGYKGCISSIYSHRRVRSDCHQCKLVTRAKGAKA